MLKTVLAMAAIVAALIFGLAYADAAKPSGDASPGTIGGNTVLEETTCFEPSAHS